MSALGEIVEDGRGAPRTDVPDSVTVVSCNLGPGEESAMVRLTRIYTKTGDKGTTALGDGRRVSKDAPRIEAFGTVDELNAVLGLAILSLADDAAADLLRTIQ